MDQDSSTRDNLENKLPLKLQEPEVLPADPWDGDKLERADIARRLTNLIKFQTDSLVLGLNGDWGTGKTFFLKRWKAHLDQKKFNAIYFNSWEDDFIDDPLIAIISTIARFSKEKGLRKLAKRIKRAARPLIINNVNSLLTKYTGATSDGWVDKAFENYSLQTESKNQLRQELRALTNELKDKARLPLVFIVDELDRCRPTFAIELLERVKHVFDVPGIVFVFGINRPQLCKSIESIYGSVQSDVYARRFFDMEFVLPDSDSEIFVKHTIQKYGLRSFFKRQIQKKNEDTTRDEFSIFGDLFSKLCEIMNLSLRDIDHCVRSMSIVGKNLVDTGEMHPYLLGVLVPMRLKKNDLYRGFVQGSRMSSEIVNYVNELISIGAAEDSNLNNVLDVVEACFYRADTHSTEGDLAKAQLELLAQGQDLTMPERLSNITRQLGKARALALIGLMNDSPARFISRDAIAHLDQLLELTTAP